jgi:hypothetical protein
MNWLRFRSAFRHVLVAVALMAAKGAQQAVEAEADVIATRHVRPLATTR